MTTRDEQRLATRIEKFIQDHPGCTKIEILREIDVSYNCLTRSLGRLRAIGHVKREMRTVMHGDRQKKVSCWMIGIEEGVILKDRQDGAPRRRFLKKWTGHVEADQLFTLFFNKHNKENTQDETAFAL